MTISAHELAKVLLEGPDLPVEISIDVSTVEWDSGNRAFGQEYYGWQYLNSNESEIVLMFDGGLNFSLNFEDIEDE